MKMHSPVLAPRHLAVGLLDLAHAIHLTDHIHEFRGRRVRPEAMHGMSKDKPCEYRFVSARRLPVR